MTGFMTFLEHLDELRRCLIPAMAVFMCNFVFFFSFGITSSNVGGFTLVYPIPTLDNSYSAFVFRWVWSDLVPAQVNGVVIQPYATLTGGMMTLVHVSAFLAVTFSMPYILWQVGKFAAPALRPEERVMILKTVLPATVLFLLGCATAYFVIIPFTIDFLLGVIFGLEAQALITVDEFVSFIVLFTLAFGLVFEMPVVMYGVTRLGLVQAKTWAENWRYAFVGMVLFGGIITPDGSGITQLMIAFTMLALYGLGYAAARRFERKMGSQTSAM